jgi:hypothetical protein
VQWGFWHRRHGILRLHDFLPQEKREEISYLYLIIGLGFACIGLVKGKDFAKSKWIGLVGWFAKLGK